MKITIHRGTTQIGGCITEIATNKAKILIDLGHNLPPSADNLANENAIQKLTDGVAAIFYTHYHGDHVDLFKYVPDHVEQYIGEVAKQVMVCKYEILGASKNVENVTPEDVKKLKTFKTYRPAQSVSVGDITVTPFFVSHSACDAYMFLIEAEGKRILHTGDFRAHGYLGHQLMDVIRKYIITEPVDALITEGTMLSRLTEKVKVEQDIQTEAARLMKQYKYVFALCSSTDIDRLAGFYQASQKTGRSFLCDDYQKKILKIFTEAMRSGLYKFNDFHYYDHGHEKQFDLIQNKGFSMLIRSKYFNNVQDLLQLLPAEQTLLIYSMWNGYLDDGENQKADYAELYKLFAHKEVLHTSGHASPKTLAEVCNLVNPTTAIIPIHTEHSDFFAKLNIREDLKAKINLLPIIDL
jgi:ribonuclease J